MAVVLGLVLVTIAAAVNEPSDTCKSRWSLGGIYPGMSGSELRDRFPDFPRSKRRVEPAIVSTTIRIGGRAVEVECGVCVDNTDHVSLIVAHFAPPDFDLEAVREWLAGQYGKPMFLGVADSFGTDGVSTGHFTSVVFDECPSHGFQASSERSNGASNLTFSLVGGTPSFIERRGDSFHIDHEQLGRVAWQYQRCSK